MAAHNRDPRRLSGHELTLTADKLPVKAIRIIAAVVFAALGIMTLSGVRL